MLSVIETCPKSKGSLQKKDLSERRYGMLTVLYFSHSSKSGKKYWVCRCDCGTQRPFAIQGAEHRTNVSCGCLRNELLRRRRTTHGMSGSTEYEIWFGMIKRCVNESIPAYKYYGGRGITVCEEWLAFENFFSDMGSRPPNASLDRIDNNQGYFKANCRWASRRDQANNKRSNVVLEVGGERLSVAQWSAKTSIPNTAIFARLRRGWTHEDAVSKPLRKMSMSMHREIS